METFVRLKNGKKAFSELKAEYVNNLKNSSNHIVRLIGGEEVFSFVVEKIDKDAVYITATHDKFFYDNDFVLAFGFGGVVVVDCKNETIAKKLLAVIEDGKLNLGACDVQMHKDFFCVLKYGLKDDYFLNGKMYQI